MRPSTEPAARGANASVIPRPPDRGARAERRVAGDLGHRERDDSVTNNLTRGVRQAPRRRVRGCRAAVDARGLAAGDVSSSIERVLIATRDTASIAAALSCLRPVPRSSRLAHLRGRRRLGVAQSRIGADLESTGGGGGTGDKQLLSVARIWAPLAPVLRSCLGTRADDGERPIHRVRVRSAQSSSPVRSSRERGEATSKDRRRCSAAPILQCTLSAGVDAIERAPGRSESRIRSTPPPAAFPKRPWRTHSALTPAPAGTSLRGCIRPRLRDVDEVGADCRQDVYGLGDEAVYSALRRSVAP
jgi:hypothetical protein